MYVALTLPISASLYNPTGSGSGKSSAEISTHSLRLVAQKVSARNKKESKITQQQIQQSAGTADRQHAYSSSRNNKSNIYIHNNLHFQ